MSYSHSSGAEAPLSRYNAKRDFTATREPKGGVARRKAKAPLGFVIQKHWASHLHYDFRLELDGVLLSWAVPKGPSFDPRQRRMAVHVEDHPVAYGSFEGTIPPKQYGAGEVIVWDNGTWEPVGDAQAGLRDGKLVFRLHGQKLAGLWQLVRTSRGDAKREQWLLIKKHDAWERPHDDYDVTMALPDSVIANPLGLLEERDTERAGRDSSSQAGAAGAGTPRGKAASATKSDAADVAAAEAESPDLSKARKAKLPATLSPQLATLVSATPPGDWIAEAKFDGYRLLTRIEKGKVQLITRGGNDWTDRMPTLVQALEGLAVDTAWLDGEVVVLGPHGSPEFNLLQNAIGRSGRAGKGGPGEKNIVYFLFDLPFLQGHDLREVPLRDRRLALRALLAGQSDDHVRFSEDFEAPPEQMLAAACQMRLEGLILKRPEARYVSDRSDTWVKLKCQLRQEFVVVGFTPRSDAPSGLGSLLLAVRDKPGQDAPAASAAKANKGSKVSRPADGGQDAWHYAGRVGTGWSMTQGQALRHQLDALVTDKPHFSADDIKRSHWTRRSGGDERWVRPEMVVEVAFAEWTPDGHIRHASFQGVREDKPADDIGRETAQRPEAVSRSAKPPVKQGRAAAKSAGTSKASAADTSADAASAKKGTKVIETAASSATGKAASTASTASTAKATKANTASKATTASKASSPAGASAGKLRITHPDRVIDEASGTTKIELVRYYESVGDWMMPHLAQRPVALVRAPDGVGGQLFFQKHVEGNDLIVIRHIADLLQFTQLNALEFHTWNSRADKLDKPDRIVFDLDPGEGVTWPQMREAAQLVRAMLEELGLQSWLKTSGGKGLHVVVPLTRRADNETSKAFSRAVVEHLAATLPKRFSAKSGPRNRVGKIFVDYLRNGEGQTTAAAFSVRARPGLGVSMPVSWDQLPEIKGGDHWTVANARDHLSFLREDPWKAFWACRQTFTAGAKMLEK